VGVIISRVYLKIKTIGGRKYKYAVKSIRLPDGSIKKLYRLIGAKKPDDKELSRYFIAKEKEANINYALRKFDRGSVFSEDEIAKIESMRVDYRWLLKKLLKADLKDMFDRFTVNFTYDSNAIEGNSLTLKDVSIVIFKRTAIKGKDLREIYETRNSRRVVDMLLKRKFDVTHEDIIKMHKILMRDIDERTGYKALPNYIIGRRVETVSPENVKEEMEKLIRLYNNSLGRLHPLEIAAIIHGRFERIHPFSDGNGRVGRCLINMILVNNGYPPLIIRKTQRETYMNTLGAFDNGYEDKLKRFLIEKYKDTFKRFFEVYVKYV